MNILDQIIVHKKKEVEENKSMFPVKRLEQSVYFDTPVVSMRKYILRADKSGIIAEFKRRSPSKGDINVHASIERVSIGYMQAGASALSVLTDKQFFGGSNEDLQIARKFNYCPILRKDFVIDEYQILEAKSIGADVILLIAAVLEKEEVKKLTGFAHSLGLEVLVEVHNREELEKIMDARADLIGVNNRNLKTFEVSIEISKELAPLMPDNVVRVSESGLSNPETLMELKKHGYDGFLMGQRFMEYGRPEEACLKFIEKYNRLKSEKVVG